MSSLSVSVANGTQTSEGHQSAPSTPRERILDVAYELFSRAGVRGVGIDEVIDRAGVAKATLYRHFPTKNELVLAFLSLREQRSTHELIEAEAERRAHAPQARLLAIFDVLDDWFAREDFEGCSFVKVLLEFGPDHPAGAASIRHLRNVRAFPERLAREAGIRDPVSLAHDWHLLMKGAVISAVEGDPHAAHRGREIAMRVLDQHQPGATPVPAT
jgi:AcrR family transcriptional regulator